MKPRISRQFNRAAIALVALCSVGQSAAQSPTESRKPWAPGERYYCKPGCQETAGHSRDSSIRYVDKSSTEPGFPPVYSAECQLRGSDYDFRFCGSPSQMHCHSSGSSEITNMKQWMIQRVPVAVHSTCSPSVFKPVVFNPAPNPIRAAPGDTLGHSSTSKIQYHVAPLFAPAYGLTIQMDPSTYTVNSDGILIGKAPMTAGTYQIKATASNAHGMAEVLIELRVAKP